MIFPVPLCFCIFNARLGTVDFLSYGNWRVQLENKGCLTAVWEAPPINERLGIFGVDGHFSTGSVVEVK